MALNLGNVSAYLDQLSQPLMHKALLQGVTNKYIKIIPNVFSQVSINLIDQSSPFSTSVVADNLTNLGFTDAGSATTTQVNITVCPLKFQQQYPIYAQGGIETTYLMYLYDAQRLKGSYHDTIPTFEEKWTDMLIKYINQQVDTTEWIGSYAPTFSGFTGNAHSGDTAGTTGGYATCQGFLYNLTNTANSASTIFTTYSGTPNQGNIVNIVNTMIGNIPYNVLDQELIIFTNPATVQYYKQALTFLGNQNIFPDDAKSVQQGGDGSANINTITCRVPGQNITMVGTVGLVGFNGLVLSYAENFYFATALESDYASIKSWFSMDFDVFRAMCRWRQGAAVAFPQYVVIY